MADPRRKKLTSVAIALLFLSGGIEYAVILPTIWAYLQTLHAEPYFLGLGISAFSLTGLLAGPLFGLWSDRTQRTKAIILFANTFEIAGNFMYFMGISKWLLLGSRLVAGVGTGAGASIFGYLTRSTTSQERATVFAVVMACRQVGLLIGKSLLFAGPGGGSGRGSTSCTEPEELSELSKMEFDREVQGAAWEEKSKGEYETGESW